MSNPKRAALYLRVNTNEQTDENERKELRAAASRPRVGDRSGVSGRRHQRRKGREDRPGFDALLKAATQRWKRFDVVMAWSAERRP
jgi:DNA invertase Pin-like site-specific DNA recombinase